MDITVLIIAGLGGIIIALLIVIIEKGVKRRKLSYEQTADSCRQIDNASRQQLPFAKGTYKDFITYRTVSLVGATDNREYTQILYEEYLKQNKPFDEIKQNKLLLIVAAVINIVWCGYFYKYSGIAGIHITVLGILCDVMLGCLYGSLICTLWRGSWKLICLWNLVYIVGTLFIFYSALGEIYREYFNVTRWAIGKIGCILFVELIVLGLGKGLLRRINNTFAIFISSLLTVAIGFFLDRFMSVAACPFGDFSPEVFLISCVLIEFVAALVFVGVYSKRR